MAALYEETNFRPKGFSRTRETIHKETVVQRHGEPTQEYWARVGRVADSQLRRVKNEVIQKTGRPAEGYSATAFVSGDGTKSLVIIFRYRSLD